MSEFAGFACWDELTVAATIKTEAVSPSLNVFFATHSPLNIQRTTLAGAGAAATTVVSEEDVLRDFLQRPANNGVLVMPVLGESGAGKSHLVRWLHAHTPSTGSRQVIYLPKDNTSLAGVIELLLADNHGSQFDEIRADMAKLGRDISQDSLEHSLLDQLAEALRLATPQSPQEKFLFGENGLYALLHDPYFREKLLRRGSLIPRRAAHAIHGKQDSEGDVPLEFTPDDLPLDLTDIGQAAQLTQRVYGRLASDTHLQVVAAEVLQRNLDIAVMKATNLGVGRVYKAFLEIRRALVGKKEIVLLVEDFVLVQGVQRDILDAITETSERDGIQRYAPMRTLMAVTTGYFGDLPPTIRTRVDAGSPFRYQLRVTLGDRGRSDTVTEDRIVDMLGRYLNAARIGRDRLEELKVTDQASTPNHCSTCPVQDPCHTGFGTSSSGYGLYPYNRASILRAVRASALTDHPDEFNPRAALAQVIRGVLQEHRGDIVAGRFPNEAFAAKFPPSRTETALSPAVRAQINAVDPTSGARRQVLLQYWGNAPSALINLAPEIHEAFAVEMLSDQIVTEVPAEDSTHRKPEQTSQTAGEETAQFLPAAAQRKIDQINNWITHDAPFPNDLANEMRGTIRSAVLSRISWSVPVMKEPTSAVLEGAWPRRATTVSIAGASESIAKHATPAIRFERTPENAVFFADLIRIRYGVVEKTLASRLRLDRLAATYAPKARANIIEHLGRHDDAVVAALRVALVGAATAGVVSPGDSPAALLNAALADLSGYKRADTRTRSPLWLRLTEKHLASRAPMVKALREAVGPSQGLTGEVHAVDVERVAPLLKAASQRWSLGPDDQIPTWAKTASQALANLDQAVEEQLAVLLRVVSEVRARLPRGTSLSQTMIAIDKAFESGEPYGFVRHPKLPELRARNLAARGLATRDVERLEDDLAGLSASSGIDDRLTVASRERGDSLHRVRDYLVENAAWLEEGLKVPVSSEAVETARLFDRLRSVISDWDLEVTKLTGGAS